jgi:hypothetical protein
VNSAKNWLLTGLALTTLGGAWIAWRQQAELAALRSAAMPRDERAEFQKRVWELEKTNRELKEQLAARREAAAEGLSLAPGSRPQKDDGNSAPRRAPENAFAAVGKLMNDPEVSALLNVQQRGAIDSRYAALFRKLNLPPEQLEKLKNLLVERTASLKDTVTVAQEQGINLAENPVAAGKLVGDIVNEINSSLRTMLGDADFAQLRSYERTLPQRSVVEDLQQRLSYTATPLTVSQADQLIDILAANPAARTAASNRPPAPAPYASTNTALAESQALRLIASQTIAPSTITPAAVAQSQSVLSAPQLAALQQMQQQQQAQQQLRRLVNDTLQPPPGPSSSGKR